MTSASGDERQSRAGMPATTAERHHLRLLSFLFPSERELESATKADIAFESARVDLATSGISEIAATAIAGAFREYLLRRKGYETRALKRLRDAGFNGQAPELIREIEAAASRENIASDTPS